MIRQKNLLNEFNVIIETKLFEFCDKPQYINIFKTIKFISPKKNVELFLDGIAPYEKYIMNRDQRIFFIEENFFETLGINKNFWNSLNPRKQSHIWDIIIYLIDISKKIINNE